MVLQWETERKKIQSLDLACCQDAITFTNVYFGGLKFRSKNYSLKKELMNFKQKFSTILINLMVWYSLGCVAAIVGPLPQIKVVLAEP